MLWQHLHLIDASYARAVGLQFVLRFLPCRVCRLGFWQLGAVSRFISSIEDPDLDDR